MFDMRKSVVYHSLLANGIGGNVMKYSYVIRKARKLIANGEQTYICLAIAQSTNFDDDGVCRFLTSWIAELLGKDNEGARTYDEWVRDFHPDFYSKVGSGCFQEGRLQWMDWMIDHFESQDN